MGFDALFFARIDYKDKEKREYNRELEWVWRPNAQSIGTDTQIFTHTLWNHYRSPEGFGFDIVDPLYANMQDNMEWLDRDEKTAAT